MSDVRLASIDLNLLVVLDELLRCRSTVKAAARLGRTQPQVSHALGRLREIFRDPLFVRAGAAMQATAFAEELAAPLRALLGSAEELVFQAAAVDPSTLERSFSISAADFAEIVLLPRLVNLLRREAPRVDLVVRFYGGEVDRAIQAGELDMALGTSFRALSGLVMQRLFPDRFVCVVRRDNQRFGETLTLDDFVAAEHVLVSPRGQPGSFVDDALERIGRRRRIALRTPHFASAFLIVAQSDLIVTLPRSFVRAAQEFVPVRLYEPPLAIAPFSFACVYSATRQKDPAHAWLRGRLAEICREIAGARD